MDKTEQLKIIIANYWQLLPEAIDWDMPVNGEQLKKFSSLRMLRFLASIEEHLNVRIEDPDRIKRFRDLLSLVTH